MDKEFLEGLGLEAPSVAAILEAYEKELAGIDLRHQVALAIGAAGGKNHKAIGALLDMDALAAAQDVQAAVREAVAAVKAENSYLFEDEKPPRYAKFTGKADPGAGSEPTSLAGALRARMRK